MKNGWKFVEKFFVITGLPIMLLVGYMMAADIMFFWQYGVEKQAIVKKIVQTRVGSRSTSYEYLFEMEEREFSRIFTERLPVGEAVDVLVSPENSEDFILGNKDDGLFELFSLSIGGHVIAVFILVVYLLVVSVMLSWTVRRVKNFGKRLER